MKFKSQIATAVSGSVGGTTYAHNQGGLYMRARSIPTNPNTLAQQNVRNAMKYLTTYWQNTMTAAQRTGWATYAKNVPLVDTLGDTRPINALSMFVRCNSPRFANLTATGVVVAPPTIYSLATFTTPVAAAVASTLSVVFTNTDLWATLTGGHLFQYLSTPQSTTINFWKGPYSYVGRIDGLTATPPTSPKVVTGVTTVVGAKYFMRFTASNADGRLSSSQVVSFIGA